MKLLNKTNLYFLGASLLIVCLGGIFFFLLFQVIIDNDLTDKLHERKDYVVKQLTRSDSLLLFQQYSANTVSILAASGFSNDVEVISDTTIYDNVELKSIGYRQLAFHAQINGNNYNIHIRRALVEQKDLIKGVVLLEVFLFLAFVTILNVINNQLSRRIWKPFYNILDTISNYKIDRAESLNLHRNSITEFNELAAAIEKMSAKINQEFSIQKEFTENASHEIQTPLAIIKNKMEILLQYPDLTEEHLSLIKAMYSAASRLSKLNEALIILSRIENRQFHVVSDICVNDLIDNRLEGLEELIGMKKITVERNYANKINTKMNPFLADILFENLIINAIKHNYSSGAIMITTESNHLCIINTGEAPKSEPEKLFQRFAKDNQKSHSLGLGLSIVKAICETYLLPILYTYEEKRHKISLKLTTKESLKI